tara:strand:- start:6219 stop:7712 length:1494 start_codon:yes stop_codon:yes gene_type:complete
MAYFNNAFRKCFVVGTDQVQGAGVNSSALTTGANGPQFAVLDASTYISLDAAGIAASTGQLMLAQSSFHNADTIGNNPGHGGYSESTKSKGVNPAYINEMWASPCCTISQSTTSICVAADCAPCGELLYLRLDVKGSPALRFLNHNAYALGDSSGDSYANGGPLPGLCCADGQTHLDPAMAIAGAAQMLLADPIISPLAQECTGGGITITATALDAAGTLGAIVGGTTYVDGTTNVPVTGGTGSGMTVDITCAVDPGPVTAVTINNPGSGYTATDIVTITGGTGDATVVIDTVVQTATYTITQVLNGGYTPSTDPVGDGVTACACFEGAYVETKFGDCSFDTRDHYNKEPVQLVGSVLDETGNPCNDCGTVTNTPGCMGQTSGETVLREVLMTEQYMQNPYNQGNPDSARIREIEGSDDVLSNINRLVNYKQYNILHSIPRFNNPSGVFDNDQYLYTIYVACTDTDAQADLEALLDAIAALKLPAGSMTLDTDDNCG